MLTAHTTRKTAQRRRRYRRHTLVLRHHALASTAAEDDLATVNDDDPPEKPKPDPDLPPPERPIPGAPKPGDPPGTPRPGDPTPNQPQPDSPRPVRPKSAYMLMVVSLLAGIFASDAAVTQIEGDDDAPFIKPWMIDRADQNYPIGVKRAREHLGWEPQHTLRQTLPDMIGRLHSDPKAWFEKNGLPVPKKVEEYDSAGAAK